MNLFDNDNQFVLFSGTSFDNDQDVFRHLNDLFFILFVLYKKGIKANNITLVADLKAIDYLNDKTLAKKVALIKNKKLTYYEIIHEIVEDFIDPKEFELKFKRNEKQNLIFFSSGHGNIHGLSIGNKFLTPDYFEENIINDKLTFLYLSQCMAGAFHHLKPMKNFIVLAASEYQSSISIPITKMKMTSNYKEIIQKFSFYDNIAINPFIFTFFINVLLSETLIKRKDKTILNLYKYINSSTIELIKDNEMEFKINIKNINNNILKIKIPYNTIQQPFILNENSARNIILS